MRRLELKALTCEAKSRTIPDSSDFGGYKSFCLLTDCQSFSISVLALRSFSPRLLHVVQCSDMHSPTVLLVLSLILRALSLAHPGPKPTDAASNAPNSVGWTPKPTTVPFANTPLELRRRQNYAPINTCGWIDGNFADPYFCADGYACSANFAAAYFGCCETDSAGSFLSADCAYIATPYTGCYDFTSASFCTGACYTENRVWYARLSYNLYS